MSDSEFDELPKAKRRNYVKKVEHEWSHDETMQLIMAVEERPMLWDIGRAEYKMPKVDAWQEVANAIGNVTVDDAKAKWMNMRISFKNNLAKSRLKKLRQGADKAVVIHWRYFKSMMFLEANDNQPSTSMSSSFLQCTCVPAAVPVCTCELGANPEPLPAPSPTPSANSMAVDSLNSPRVDDNRFSVFGDYIASELRVLPPHRGTFVQRELNHELLRLLEDVNPSKITLKK